MRTALTIAGSDSGGGAGIQADLKSFAAVGVHGTSVITCVTAQNTRAVASIFPLPVEEIEAQLRAVLDDFDVSAAKTGMLYSADIVKTVARGLGDATFPLVVDPVMVATVGARLERDDFRDALVEHLLPQATLVTPNRRETERLAGSPVRSVEEMETAAKAIHALGPSAVLVKGGHVAGELVDVLYDGRTMRRLRGFRYPKELHGAGCTLASSIAGYLAKGEPLIKAVEGARRRVAAGFLASYRAGRGVEIINSQVLPDRYGVWLEVTDRLPSFLAAVPRRLAPASGPGLGFALPAASRIEDVCTLRPPSGSRGARASPWPVAVFGGDADLARSILNAMIVQPAARAAAKLKTSPQNAQRLESTGFTVAAARRGGGWTGVGRGVVPDVALGGAGREREAKMVVHGEDLADVLRKVRRIARVLGR